MNCWQQNPPEARCLGKEIFASPSLAHKVAKKMAKAKKAKGQDARLEPYRCPICGQWHLAAAKRHYSKARRKGF